MSGAGSSHACDLLDRDRLRYSYAMNLRLVLGSLLLIACGKKDAKEEPFANFLAPVGAQIWPACTSENDGKRFLVHGYVRPQSTTTVEDGKVNLDFYEKPNGEGRSFPVEMKEGKHVRFETADAKKKFFGGSMGTSASLVGVTLVTNKGDAKLDEKVGVIVEQKVLTKFQSKEISACTLTVDEITK